MNMDRNSSPPSDTGIEQPSTHFLVPVVPTLLLVVSSLILASCGSSGSAGGSGQTPTSTPATASLLPRAATASPTPPPHQALQAIQMLNTTTGWAIGANNHVLRTTDGGASWKDVTPKYPANAALTPVGIGTDFLSGDLAWWAV